MNKLIGVFLLITACCTYLTCLLGNVLVAFYVGSKVASVFGLLAMCTVCWQIGLAFKKIKE